MDNKSTTKRMIGAVVLVLIAALLLAWLLKGKNKSVQEQQELIAEQTQDASPILGFPGVSKEGEEVAEGQVAQNGEAAQDGSGSYVIGATDQQNGTAQQEAQNALAAGGEQVVDATQAAGAATTDAAGTAATAGSETVQTVAAKADDSATGFQVRDSQSGDAASTEQRQVVDGGKAEAGTGSMGANEVATTDQVKQAADGDATQTAAASGDGTKAADGGDATGGAAQQQPKVAAADSGGDSSATKKQPAKKTAAANPKLVNEKPVPAPKTQSASKSADEKKSSGGNSQQASASSRSSSGSAAGGQSAIGAKGYAIQVLAASSRKKAETVQKDIARDGYPAFVVRANVNGKTVYRVRVGTYPAKGDARAVQTTMKARYSQNQYVQNSFVTKN